MAYRITMIFLMIISMTALVVMLNLKQAQAIPAFARTHGKPCIHCHVAFPKLNDVGMEFEHHGFRMPGEEGTYLWEQPLPFAGKINLQYLYNTLEWDPEVPAPAPGMPNLVDKKTSALELFDVQLFTGGTLAPNVSYFGQIVFKVPGLGPDATDDIGDVGGFMMANTLTSDTRIEAFWVQLDDILPDGMLNLRIGKDHVDNDFLSTPLRLTRASRLIMIQPMLGASLHPMAVGVDLNGKLHTRPIALDYDFGVRNYGAAYDSDEDNEQRLGAYYGLINAHAFGQTLSLIVSSDKRGDENTGTDDNVMGYGASLDLHWGPVNFIPGIFMYNEGGDIRGGNDLNVLSGTAELIYTIFPELLGTLRYDFNTWDLDNDSLSDRDARVIVVSLAWYPHPNVRWVAEYNRIDTANMMFMRDEVGLQMLAPTPSETDLTQDIAVLMLELDF